MEIFLVFSKITSHKRSSTLQRERVFGLSPSLVDQEN